MSFNSNTVSELREHFEAIQSHLESFKELCRMNMHSSEYQQFKYNVLGHLEPHVSKDHEWMTPYAESLEKYVERAEDDVINEDSYEEDENDNAQAE